jgi:hypothetical protein
MRMRQAIRDPSGETAAVDQPASGLSRERLGLLPAMTAKAYEQGLLVAKPALRRERVDLNPRVDSVLDDVGH